MTRIRRLCLLILSLLACGQPAVAAAAPVEGYLPHDQFIAALAQLDRSDLVSLTTLAKTQASREVVLITLSRGKPESKPAFLIVGNVHGPHLAGGEMALRLAQSLVAKSDDEKIKPLLDRFTFYIIPRPSPDATEAFFTAPTFEREGNDRQTDDDRDGKVNEDGPDDLNADGVITMMRIADATGEWIEHPDDSRVLIKADPLKNETGKYRLLTEGIDNDSDESFNEDGPGGVAFNRNFTHQYSYFKPGAGPHQVSEPETRAIADFAFERTNIATVITFTLEDNLFNPWKPNPQADGARIKTHILSSDAPYHEFVAKSYRETHGAKDAPGSPDGNGSFSEWAYFHYGRWSFATRGWWVEKVEGIKEVEKVEEVKKAEEDKEKAKEKEKKKPSDEKRGAEEINALRWLAANKVDGFVDWKRVEHPDFKGKTVEIGGFKPYVLLNPPVAQLDALTDKHVKWLGDLAALMPKVSVSETKVEPLGGNVYRVNATVINTGYLPSMSEMGRITRQPLPLQLAIELPKDAAVIQGTPRKQVNVLKGNGGTDHHTWLIQAPTAATARVKVWSPSVGEHAVEIELKESKMENAK